MTKQLNIPNCKNSELILSEDTQLLHETERTASGLRLKATELTVKYLFTKFTLHHVRRSSLTTDAVFGERRKLGRKLPKIIIS